MNIQHLSEILTIETNTTTKEFIDFAKIILKNDLYVKGFSMSVTLAQTISKMKDQDHGFIGDSFISLLKLNNNYIGVCCFLEHHPITIQTYILPEHRGMNYAYMLAEETIKKLKNNFESKKKISLHYGNEASVILFYKLWSNKIIKLTDLYNTHDQSKLRHIKNKITGKETKPIFLTPHERRVIDNYTEKRKVKILQTQNEIYI